MPFPVQTTVSHAQATTILFPDGGYLFIPAGTFAADQTLKVRRRPYPICPDVGFAGHAYEVQNVSASPLNPTKAMTITLRFLPSFQSLGPVLTVFRADLWTACVAGDWMALARIDPMTAGLMGVRMKTGAKAWCAYAVGRPI